MEIKKEGLEQKVNGTEKSLRSLPFAASAAWLPAIAWGVYLLTEKRYLAGGLILAGSIIGEFGALYAVYRTHFKKSYLKSQNRPYA